MAWSEIFEANIEPKMKKIRSESHLPERFCLCLTSSKSGHVFVWKVPYIEGDRYVCAVFDRTLNFFFFLARRSVYLSSVCIVIFLATYIFFLWLSSFIHSSLLSDCFILFPLSLACPLLISFIFYLLFLKGKGAIWK